MESLGGRGKWEHTCVGLEGLISHCHPHNGGSPARKNSDLAKDAEG